jgi:hypothetical protein
VLAEISKVDVGPGDQVGHRSRNQDLTGRGLRHHSLRDMDGDSCEIVAVPFDLTRMKTGPDLQAECAKRAADRTGTTDRPGRTVKRGQETVARVLHLATPEPVQFFANDGVVARKQFAPTAVAETTGKLCGLDEVGEQDRGQQPIGGWWSVMTGKERLDGILSAPTNTSPIGRLPAPVGLSLDRKCR